MRIEHGKMCRDGVAVHILSPRSVRRALKDFRRIRHGILVKDGVLTVNGKTIRPARWPLVFRTDAFRRLFAEDATAFSSRVAQAYEIWS